jgi:PadR family transcriptional regulator PadR
VGDDARYLANNVVVSDIDPQMLKGLLSLLLLALLADHDDYGYSLRERLRAGWTERGRRGHRLPRARPTGTQGLGLDLPRGIGPRTARKYYRLSKAGLAELGDRVNAWRHLSRVIEHSTKGTQT